MAIRRRAATSFPDRIDMSTYIAADPETFTFASEVDQAPIFVRKWLPPCGIRPRATLQITHGIAEHSGRYDRFARFLAAKGYVVYALDLRGHGETAGPVNLGQAGATAWDDMTADIKQLADIARADYPTANADDEHRSNAAGSPGATAQDHLTSTGFTIRMNFCTPTTGVTTGMRHE
jgi:hypothetical protein